MEYTTFITTNMLIAIPCLYILGEILKLSNVNNKYIPAILLIVGIVIGIGQEGLTIDALIQGILTTGSAVLTNEILSQRKK